MDEIQLKVMTNLNDLARCFVAMQELRPHLMHLEDFMHQVQVQQEQGYILVAALNGHEVVACVGFRLMHMLAFGKMVYIDDLICLKTERKQGLANKLLDYVINYAKENNCQEVHLDTGYQRYAAHKVYLNKGFQLNCHHMALKLQGGK